MHPLPLSTASAPLRELWMQIAQTSSARAYCMAATVAVLTARYLGPEGRGVVAAAEGWPSSQDGEIDDAFFHP